MAKRDEFKQARLRGERRRASEPYAVDARYDRRQQRIVVQLNNGLQVVFGPRMIEDLEDAKPRDLQEIAPKSVDFVASLPRSPVGKVLKKTLRAPSWAGHEREI